MDIARERLAALWTRLHGELALQWTVRQMAELVHMSESHFARTVQSLYGMQPMRMLAGLRMEHAAALLRSTGSALETVAESCGYASAYAFSAAFLRHFGVRPGRYRRGGTAEKLA